MKLSNLFWGILFLSLGLLILINNFFNISIDISIVWKIAPIFLILIGFSLMIKSLSIRYILVVISSIILSLTIFAAFDTPKFWGNIYLIINNDKDVKTDNTLFSYDYNDKIKEVKLSFNASAGKFDLSDDFLGKSSTENLVLIKTSLSKDFYDMNVNQIDSIAEINFLMKDAKIEFGDSFNNKVNLYLNENPLWDLNFNCGASKMDFDLKKFKVKNIDVKMGAADLDLKIGDKYSNVRISIDAGASRIKIKIPENFGCEIVTDAVLSHRDFEGFKKTESNVFRTENFNASENKIFIDLNCGASSIAVKRY